MIWQDIAMTITSIVLSVSMFPQVYHGFKEKIGPIKYQTSVPTFLGLCVMTFVYSTLGLYITTVVSCLTTFMWLLLIIQRYTYHNRV